MTEEVKIALIVLSASLSLAAIVLHILPLFLRGGGSGTVKYVNLGIHVLLFPLLFALGADLWLVVIAIMSSVCIYTAVGYIKMKREGGK